jgi:hypothetical protein
MMNSHEHSTNSRAFRHARSPANIEKCETKPNIDFSEYNQKLVLWKIRPEIDRSSWGALGEPWGARKRRGDRGIVRNGARTWSRCPAAEGVALVCVNEKPDALESRPVLTPKPNILNIAVPVDSSRPGMMSSHEHSTNSRRVHPDRAANPRQAFFGNFGALGEPSSAFSLAKKAHPPQSKGG